MPISENTVSWVLRLDENIQTSGNMQVRATEIRIRCTTKLLSLFSAIYLFILIYYPCHCEADEVGRSNLYVCFKYLDILNWLIDATRSTIPKTNPSEHAYPNREEPIIAANILVIGTSV